MSYSAPLTSVHLTPLPDTLKSDLLYSFNYPFELKQLHALVIKTNTPHSALPLSRVASVCAFTPSFSYARRIIEFSGEPEITVWNSCLKASVESSSPADALRLLCKLLDSNVGPDSFTFLFALKACSNLSDLVSGRTVHGLILKLGFGSNLFLQNTIVHLYATCGAFGDARQLFDKMPQRDVVTWNTMITQLVKREDVDAAYELFSGMTERNVRSWTAMITGFVQCGRAKEAIEVFSRMEEEGSVVPNEVTVVAVLAACADLGALDLGERVHRFSNRKGFGRNVRVCNTLIDMYIKCGCLGEAQTIFDEMEEKTVVSWSAIINGFAIHGKAETALRMFSEMIEAGIEPNGVTFIGLLHACSHMGLVNKGRAFFTSMTRDYGIVPWIEHYGCMVDLLSRAGLIDEAREFIMNMPVTPNAVVWGALLGGCKVHKSVEIAEEAIGHLMELDPLNDGYYIVLSNIYAEAKRWEDVSRVRELMRARGVKKTPGWSSIMVDGTVHEFVAGEETHPCSEEIFRRWEMLSVEMRDRGYVPDTSVVLLDIEESEKVKYVYRHSEKLATMFGLISTAKETTIRIMKNLRVCEDCHAALKLVSEIENREIIVRDRSRFHCFKDGSCSCNGYW